MHLSLSLVCVSEWVSLCECEWMCVNVYVSICLCFYFDPPGNGSGISCNTSTPMECALCQLILFSVVPPQHTHTGPHTHLFLPRHWLLICLWHWWHILFLWPHGWTRTGGEPDMNTDSVYNSQYDKSSNLLQNIYLLLHSHMVTLTYLEDQLIQLERQKRN